jgi:hypothetical protein
MLAQDDFDDPAGVVAAYHRHLRPGGLPRVVQAWGRRPSV